MRTKKVCFVRNFFSTAYFAALVFFFLSPSHAGAGVTMDGSLGAPGALTGPDYQITSDLGQIRGNNLFQSFSTFSLVAGESATFSGPTNIVNIIGRVTGGPSSIDGIISSTIDGANLFLLNPSGVMFGPNAGLDVKGSFHVSTADYLKFSNGDVFYADPAASSVLSVAAPEAFGFLSPSPAGISGDKAYLQVPEGQTISIVGGDISYQAYPLSTDASSPDFVFYAPGVLSAPGGRINLVSLASPGEVNLSTLDTGTAKLGKITFTDGAKLDVLDYYYDYDYGDYVYLPAGSIYIRGGQMLFRDGGMDVYGDPGGVVDIQGGSLNLDSYYIFAASYGDYSHPGTACQIDLTGDFLMTHSSLIDTQNWAAGRGGDIRISAGNIKLGDDVLDERSYTGPDLGYYGYIAAQTIGGSGNSGDIYLTSAGDLTVQNGFFVSTTTLWEGNAGNITVLADTVNLLNMGSIGTDAFAYGNGGIVDVTARDITISAANANALVTPDFQSITGLRAQTDYFSNGGKITLTAYNNLEIINGGQISTVVFGEGRGADVEINAKNITISGYLNLGYGTPPYSLSAIDGRVYGAYATGTGGNITVTADNSLTLDNGGVIRTGLYADEYGEPSGNAGNITVNAGNIDISSRGQIYADSFRGTGNSGDITINANTLTITGAADVPRPEPLDFDFTGLSTTTNSGNGGTINVSLTGDLTLTAQGAISADTQGKGLGGAVNIIAVQNVLLTDQGKISSASTLITNDPDNPPGNAGDINITAGDTVALRESSITTEAEQADGGNITIHTPYMLYLVDSAITSSVNGGPQTTGGNITIDPQYVILKNSQIVANAFEGTGGNISIVADTFLEDPESVVDASSQLGIDGTVDIQAPITNVSGLLSPLPTDFVSASALLRERCMARTREGKYSSFIIGGRDGLPIEPGNFLPGLMY
jgi:filamentous hemagglutinin family protein